MPGSSLDFASSSASGLTSGLAAASPSPAPTGAPSPLAVAALALPSSAPSAAADKWASLCSSSLGRRVGSGPISWSTSAFFFA